MDASRGPIPAPGMVMSRYHRIPGPCILPVRSQSLPEEGYREEAPLSNFCATLFLSLAYLSSYRSSDPPFHSLPLRNPAGHEIRGPQFAP